MGTEEQEALRLSLEEQQRAAHEAKSSETTAAPASAPAAVKPEPAAAPGALAIFVVHVIVSTDKRLLACVGDD